VSEETPGGARIERGPLRRTLDACVFAPVGVAVTLAEELPEFVDKGRQRVQVQLGNAKIVGRFVVTRGQRRLTDRIGSVLHGMDDDDVRHGGGGGDSDSPSGQQWAPGRDHDHDRGRDRVASYAAPPRAESARVSAPDPAAAAIVERALADYDTLSASQVVRRLESLGPDELHAVQRYEASTRNRRTILNRASQLLEEGPAAAAGE
jgi:hypothetical protein